MLDLWHTGIVTKLVDETHNTRRFWVQVPDMERFDFKPGQFVTLDLPIHEKKTNAGVVIPLPPIRMAPMNLSW